MNCCRRRSLLPSPPQAHAGAAASNESGPACQLRLSAGTCVGVAASQPASCV